ASVTNVFWTLGAYDGLLIFEAPDDETATALMLHLGKAGRADDDRPSIHRRHGPDRGKRIALPSWAAPSPRRAFSDRATTLRARFALGSRAQNRDKTAQDETA